MRAAAAEGWRDVTNAAQIGSREVVLELPPQSGKQLAAGKQQGGAGMRERRRG